MHGGVNRYHDKPENSEGIPEFRVVDTSYEDGYSSASFTCYACDMWDGNRLDIDAENQPWIWAASSFQGHTSDDPNKPLTRHNFYGKSFQLSSHSHPSRDFFFFFLD